MAAPHPEERGAVESPAPGVFGHPAVDCDVHLSVPGIRTLIPYLDRYWQQQFLTRGIDLLDWTLTGDPPNAASSGRPDWRPSSGAPGSDLDLLRRACLDGFGSHAAIGNCVFGGQALHSEDMSAVVCKAVNDWITAEWLDREPRLRASIVVPLNNPRLAVEEIERRAEDNRFVQVQLLAMGQIPLGRRANWPIFEVAARNRLAIGVHAGSLYAHPPYVSGFGSYFVEDYVAQAFGFESDVLSLVSEGVFAKYPDLKFVFIESGVTWLPPALWRFDKTWRGVRAEVPWVKKAPSDIVRENIRLTLQPFDEPDGGGRLERFCQQMDSDRMILFSTDFPHWHFDDTEALPINISSPLVRRILWDNPRETYPRLASPATEVSS